MTRARVADGQFIRYSDAAATLCAAIADSNSFDHRVPAELLDRVYELALQNEVESLVVHAAKRSLGDHMVPAAWQDGHARSLAKITAYMAELDRVAALLAHEGITVIALKNAGIARAIYPCAGCCPMGDIDLLVERASFRRVHEILLSDGYSFEYRSPLEENQRTAAELSGGGEYRKRLSDGKDIWVEVQWRSISGRWIRPDQEPETPILMGRSIGISGSAARLLGPEDNLLQVAVHTAKHSYVRAPGFRLHTDVDRIVRRQPIHWDVFVKLVGSLQVNTAVYFSLAIPHDIFGTPIPESVLERLRPARWKTKLMTAWLRRVGLLNPQEKKFGRVGYVLFTALLYDDLAGFVRAIVPDPAWMKMRYGLTSSRSLPLYYARRMLDLAFRRVQP